MGRMAGKIAAVTAAILLLLASSAFGEAAKGKTVHRLGEVKIVGSVEHPGVLFFLPRAKFRLLPVRDRHGGTERLLRDDRRMRGFTE
ncbi:MAG: hypothetical protein HW377_2573 [Actinobacteria bacterium]|nr:hypothetical protein [Actinomycetota bacterium]